MNIPAEAVLAHGYIHAFEPAHNPDGPLTVWINTDFLHRAPVLGARMRFFNACVQRLYAITDDLEHPGYPTFGGQVGALHETFRFVAQRIAYDPLKPDPDALANMLHASWQNAHQVSQHIGAHPLRLHAFAHWLSEQQQPTQDLPSAVTIQRQFLKHELASITSAFLLASIVDLPEYGTTQAEVMNYETLASKRTRIMFVE